jgi:hypothetical protein
MAVKTFSVSEVLTASDTNSYLANSGLVFISQTTVTGGSGTVSIPSVFSSTYDSYRIVVAGASQSVAGFSWLIQFSGSSTSYYGSQYFDLFSGGSGTNRANNGAALYAGIQDTNSSALTLDITNPFTSTKITTIGGTFYGGGYSGWCAGAHTLATSHTGFYLLTGSGTWNSGGTVTIYGYRKQ